MCSIRGILGAAGVAALAVAAGGSLYYLYRSRAQKPTTTEETTVTPVGEDTETVEEIQAEPMVEPVLSKTVMELVEEDGGVDCLQEEDQTTLIMDEAPEAPSLFLVTDLTETEEAEVTLYSELPESVVKTLVEDGGVDCPQEEDQTTLIMDEAPEAPSLLQVTDLAETEEAEVTLYSELCESVVETLVEDGGVDCPQEEDQTTLIMDEAPEAPSLFLVTDLAETEKAEVTLYSELCESVVETLVEDGVDCPQEEDQTTLIMDEAPEAPSLLQVTDLAETEEAEVTLYSELRESVVETLVEDGGVDCPQNEDQATLIMDEAPEVPSLLLVTDLAETEEAEVIVEPKLCESAVETMVDDEGEEVEWWRPQEEEDEDKEQPLPGVYQLYKDWPITKHEQPKEQRQKRRKREREIGHKKDSGEEAVVTVEPELCESVVEALVLNGEVTSPQDTDPAETKEAETKAECRSEAESKKKQRRRGTRGKGRKIKYKKDSVED